MNYENYTATPANRRSLSYECERLPLHQRLFNVQRQLVAIVDLGAWVRGEQDVVPDCTILNDHLTRDAIMRTDFSQWVQMFRGSLVNYADLLTADLSALERSDTVGLEGMIRQATIGIMVWVKSDLR